MLTSFLEYACLVDFSSCRLTGRYHTTSAFLILYAAIDYIPLLPNAHLL
jgi:hypothetical protein